MPNRKPHSQSYPFHLAAGPRPHGENATMVCGRRCPILGSGSPGLDIPVLGRGPLAPTTGRRLARTLAALRLAALACRRQVGHWAVRSAAPPRRRVCGRDLLVRQAAMSRHGHLRASRRSRASPGPGRHCVRATLFVQFLYCRHAPARRHGQRPSPRRSSPAAGFREKLVSRVLDRARGAASSLRAVLRRGIDDHAVSAAVAAQLRGTRDRGCMPPRIPRGSRQSQVSRVMDAPSARWFLSPRICAHEAALALGHSFAAAAGHCRDDNRRRHGEAHASIPHLLQSLPQGDRRKVKKRRLCRV